MAEKDEPVDLNKKIFFTTADLDITDDGNFKCLCCSFNSKFSEAVVVHISWLHPQYTHKRIRKSTTQASNGILFDGKKKGKKKKLGSSCKNSRREGPRGLSMWTSEELSDPNKKLHYTASCLERSAGKLKCFCCLYSNIVARNVTRHISLCHPRFVLEPLPQEQNKNKNGDVYPRRGIDTWTKEELADPNKKLSFTSRDLEKVDGQVKCFVCSYSLASPSHVCRHIEKHHSKFLYERLSQYEPRRKYPPSHTPTENNKIKKSRNETRKKIDNGKVKSFPSSPRRSLRSRKSVFYAESPCYKGAHDVEMMYDDGDPLLDVDAPSKDKEVIMKDEPEEANTQVADDLITMWGDSQNVSEMLDFTLDGRVCDFEGEQSSYCLISRGQHLVDEKTNVIRMNGVPEETDIQNQSEQRLCDNNIDINMSMDIPDVIHMDPADNQDKLRNSGDDKSNVDSHKKKDVLLMKLQVVSEHLTTSMDSLKTRYDYEISKLKEDLLKKNEVDMNQLVDVKPGVGIQTINPVDSNSTADRRVSELLAQLESERTTFGDVISAKEKVLENSEAKSAERISELTKQLEVEREKVAALEKQVISRGMKYANLKSQNEEMRKQFELENEKAKELEANFKHREEELTKKNSNATTVELTKQLEAERRKVAALENQMIARGAKYCNLKTKIEEMRKRLNCENEKTKDSKRREKELTKKLLAAESELNNYRKVNELREKQEKLRLEQQQGEKILKKIKKEAERVLEETRSVQEERLKEIEKIKAELSFID